MNRFTEYLSNYTAGKKVCILGLGREGRSTYRLLEKYCSPAAVAVADLNPVDREKNSLPDSVELITGEGYQECLNRFDIVFKSPGIVLSTSPAQLRCEITSETQVFFTVFREQIIGITGTKGKSTVTSLIYHILKESGVDCRIAGNIGIPVFDIAEDMGENTVVVCELSCHQLEYMTVSPSRAVFLNLYEEHLDHYGTMENYYNAKKNIYLHQHDEDTLLINSEIAPKEFRSWYVYTVSNSDPSADVFVSGGTIIIEDSKYVIPTDKIKLLGVHNHYNIAVAYEMTVMSSLVELEDFDKALCTFDPLAHRLEFVDTVKGIRWYDDSISTACATAIEAVKSVPEAATILVGGMDRGIDYTPLPDFLTTSEVNVICMEASGKRVYDMLSESAEDLSRIYYVPHLEDAVKLAAEITPEGRSCVLSPAAASYGIFKNFEERGDVFKKLVKELGS